ncbi:MAG: PEP-CTERM/exosortase system-associated acyltransferase [Halomonas sp.]|uniref:PEP-CTERM/exosortase system-associated acyltransferase n=1 Tax=Halomonas sp. TaxID=1486246 RepID=UPI001A0282F3|nr:PEP-CTERM/exosortase system-associated acyltransferase [Halomonas sp.]MBE0490075.1 PEP-CTERM/exosortase system-associated acyltransferase [Halomonas sp.]
MKPLASNVDDSEKVKSLLERFMRDFSFQIATSDLERQQVYRLRHDVYCEELHGIEPVDPIKRLEYDIFDHDALHCMIRHHRTGMVAACTRLVIPQPDAPPPLDKLPLQSYAGESLFQSNLHPDNLPKDSYYEISRLAIARQFRLRLKGNEVPGITDNPHAFTAEEKEIFSLLISGLFLAGYALGRMTGKQLCFAMMEPKLRRLLAMSGFHFTQVGEPINLHGKRSAYCLNREQAEAGMHRSLLPLYQHIKEELEPQLDAIRRSSSDSLLYS